MAESIVNIEVEDLKRVELVKVNGRIDSSNAAEFDNVLKEVVGRKHNVVLEMSGVDYISSAGLRAMIALLRECKKHKGNVRLANPSERVVEVLALAGLDSLFDVYDSEAAAVGSF
ncbi:putative Anti-sigma-B factor antagonist [Candidatus Promineifilum breve]|uniref:Anti-sigma factor antagonist n=1 Tax=Candidatus Promineifilum breve TaxID=1806508 RepID=A0A160T3J0_9CHLR|nr:STAS domain-containing protein [Candidatus Promineifilum breve]CUS03110.2 putative Anti-sigma-B factor antagonist [Candidatus Promineifilum breve]